VIGPGLAKARLPPLLLSRSATLVQASDARWRELFESADVITEGGARAEPGGPVWYGSTSVILPIPAADGERDLVAACAERDVHLRLRAIRTAHREASLRAPSRLGRFSCEIRVTPDPLGLRIDVDAQAPLIEGRAISRPAR
jgi:hypothetical protein